MAGNPVVTKSASFPPPVGGLDYVTPPNQLGPTMARELLNYYIFDWGIRQVNIPVSDQTFASNITYMFTAQSTTASLDRLVIFSGTQISRYNPFLNTVANITGALVITSSGWTGHYFNGRVFFYNGVDTPIIYTVASGTAAAATWTLAPGQATLIFGWNYRGREYTIQNATASVWYAGTVGALTGALTQFDLSDALLNGGQLLFGASWPYNQGLTTEELWVVVSVSGEILVYSGNNPAASNWQLVGRAIIPTPVGNQCFIKLGDDILIGTTRGVVSLKQVFAGRVEDAIYYNVSKNVNPLELLNVTVTQNRGFPNLYWMNNSDNSIYTMNYERGAWSRINFGFTGGARPGAMAYVNNSLYYAIGTNLSHIPDAATSSLGQTYTWSTPYFDFGSPLQKIAKFIRVIGKNINSTTSSEFFNAVTARHDFNETGPTQLATLTQTVTTNVYGQQQLAPPATGERLSYIFSKTGVGEINELNGLDIYYEEGGLF